MKVTGCCQGRAELRGAGRHLGRTGMQCPLRPCVLASLGAHVRNLAFPRLSLAPGELIDLPVARLWFSPQPRVFRNAHAGPRGGHRMTPWLSFGGGVRPPGAEEVWARVGFPLGHVAGGEANRLPAAHGPRHRAHGRPTHPSPWVRTSGLHDGSFSRMRISGVPGIRLLSRTAPQKTACAAPCVRPVCHSPPSPPLHACPPVLSTLEQLRGRTTEQGDVGGPSDCASAGFL